MQWKAKYTKADYPEGATRLKRCFAWLPLYIDGTMIWLETYDTLQGYIYDKDELVIDGEKVVVITKYWKNKGKRCK
jgi:hypothetical protein